MDFWNVPEKYKALGSMIIAYEFWKLLGQKKNLTSDKGKE